MKLWKKKYLALLLTLALGAGAMALAACDENTQGSGQGNQGNQSESSSVDTGSSVSDSSLDENSSSGGGAVKPDSSDDKESSDKGESSVKPDDKDSSGNGGGQQKPDDSAKTVSKAEWEKAFTMTNYAFTITQTRFGEVNEEYNFSTDCDGNKYAVNYGDGKGIETYVETLGSYESYNRYEKNEKTAEWEKIFVSGEHNYSEMYFALHVYDQAFGKAFDDFTYDAEKEVYYVEGANVEEITGGEMSFDKVEIAFQGAKLKEVSFFWKNKDQSESYSMVTVFSKWGEISITLPEAKEEVKTATEAEWERTLGATNYTAIGEMWSATSQSPTLMVMRESGVYYMLAGSEEYLVDTEKNIYYRLNENTKEWEEDNSQTSQQHMIPEQMRAGLSGKYTAFTYNEETELFEAANVTLNVMGQDMSFDKVTVSFVNKNLSVMYCEMGGNGMRFTYSQYGTTKMEDIDTSVGGGSGSSSSENNTTNSGQPGFSTEDTSGGSQGDDHQEPKITLEEWNSALSTTNYKVNVWADYADFGYTLSRDGNIYYLEMARGATDNEKESGNFYFEVTSDCVYIYHFESDNRTWIKEEYTQEWEDEIAPYYGVDIFLEELRGKYNEFDIRMDNATAKNITVVESVFEKIDVEIRNGMLSQIRTAIQDLGDVMMDISNNVKIRLPQI